jgi:hypothetical protein
LQQGLYRNTKKWWQYVQLPRPSFSCYKVHPLLHHMTSVATRPMLQHLEVVANMCYPNAHGLVAIRCNSYCYEYWVWQQGLFGNTKNRLQHVQLPHLHCRCYKAPPLLLRRLFIAIGYITTVQ